MSAAFKQAAERPIDSVDMAEAVMPEPVLPEPVLRLATPEDAPALLDLLRQMHREVGVGILNEDKAVPVGSSLLNDPMATVFVVTLGADMIGTIALRLCPYMWYSKDFFLADQWLFVRSGPKRAAAAKLLIDAAKKLAQGLERPLLIGILGGEKLDRRMRFFKQHGLEQIGAMFIWHPV